MGTHAPVTLTLHFPPPEAGWGRGCHRSPSVSAGSHPQPALAPRSQKGAWHRAGQAAGFESAGQRQSQVPALQRGPNPASLRARLVLPETGVVQIIFVACH